MVLPAALVTAAVPAAVLLLAAAVGIAAAAGALAVPAGLGIPQPDIGHAVLHHAHTIAGIGDGVKVKNAALCLPESVGAAGR